MTKLTKIEQNIQAILFAAGEPYEKERLAKLLEIDCQTLEQLVERINEWYEDTPFILLELDQCYQMATRAEYAQVIRQALEVKNNTPLSQAALEVLAIIAFRQPVTRADIEKIRGVSSERLIASLLQQGLIRDLGRKDTPGRPIIYGTSAYFLECIGMDSLSDLARQVPEELLQEPAADAETVKQEEKVSTEEEHEGTLTKGNE